jgi:hypothetical protein
MHHLESVEQGSGDAIQVLLRRWPTEAGEPGLQVLPVLVVHHHVGGGVCLEDARDAHDAWMPEAGEHARFLQKALPAPIEGLLVALRLGPHAHGGVAIAEVDRVVFLQRNRGAEIEVSGGIGDAKTAAAEHALDRIGPIQNNMHRQKQATVHGSPSDQVSRSATLAWNVFRRHRTSLPQYVGERAYPRRRR